MSEQEIMEQLDYVLENQMNFVRDRIMQMSLDDTQFGALNALYEEYHELFNDGEIDLLSVNPDNGEINEYTICCE
jgi:hypothetical protein